MLTIVRVVSHPARYCVAYPTYPKLTGGTPVLTSYQRPGARTRFLTYSLIQYRPITGQATVQDNASVIHSATKEVKEVSSDLAKTIAGNRIDPDANDPSAVTRERGAGKAHHGTITQDFVSLFSGYLSLISNDIGI